MYCKQVRRKVYAVPGFSFTTRERWLLRLSLVLLLALQSSTSYLELVPTHHVGKLMGPLKDEGPLHAQGSRLEFRAYACVGCYCDIAEAKLLLNSTHILYSRAPTWWRQLF